jgi:hypothetical protein
MAEMMNRRRDVQAHPPVEGAGDVVRILTELTGDFERFDSMIHEQRWMLEHSDGWSGQGLRIDRESLRFRLEAEEIALRTRKALDRLRLLAEPAKSSNKTEPAGGLARGTTRRLN